MCYCSDIRFSASYSLGIFSPGGNGFDGLSPVITNDVKHKFNIENE